MPRKRIRRRPYNLAGIVLSIFSARPQWTARELKAEVWARVDEGFEVSEHRIHQACRNLITSGKLRRIRFGEYRRIDA